MTHDVIELHEARRMQQHAQQALVIKRVSDVQSQLIHWLWRRRIALGKLTLIAGDPGLGKSQFTAYLAAVVTTEGRWPNEDGRPPIGGVLMLSCEDDIADTIRPRLEAAGANLEKVQVIEAVRTQEGRVRGFNLVADLDKIETVLRRDPSIRLGVIDPITAYLGGTDTHRTSDVRAALSPLQTLASQYGVAVVAISHLNKATGGGKSINAVTGSGAFVAAARASFLVIRDEGDDDRRLLVESKNNLGKAPALAFRINQREIPGGIIAPYVTFDSGTVDVTADEALSRAAGSDDERDAVGSAENFLEEVLGDSRLSAAVVQALAKKAGHAWRTVERAGKRVDVAKQKEGFGKESVWWWSMPKASKTAKEDEDRQANKLAAFGEIGGLCATDDEAIV